MTCVNQHNRTKLPEIRQMLWSWGVQHWRVFGIDPMGRAAKNPELLLSDEEFRQVLDYEAGHGETSVKENISEESVD